MNPSGLIPNTMPSPQGIRTDAERDGGSSQLLSEQHGKKTLQQVIAESVVRILIGEVECCGGHRGEGFLTCTRKRKEKGMLSQGNEHSAGTWGPNRRPPGEEDRSTCS